MTSYGRIPGLAVGAIRRVCDLPGLAYLIPLAFAVTVPAETLTARRGPLFVLVGIGITAAMVGITRWIWSANLKRYSGASA